MVFNWKDYDRAERYLPLISKNAQRAVATHRALGCIAESCGRQDLAFHCLMKAAPLKLLKGKP